MQTQSHSLDNIKNALDQNGFHTSWINPFMKWQRPDLYVGTPEPETGTVLYVCDPPIVWLEPFDLAMVTIRIDEEIYFEVSLYFVGVLEDQTDAVVINEIYDHNNYWLAQIASFYDSIAQEFSLKWYAECDYYIEDSLYGEVESEDTIIKILISLRERYDDRWIWISTDGAGWSSEFPAIERTLEQYRHQMYLLDRIKIFTI